MDLFEELRALLSSLGQEGLPYALCGGLALAVYGLTRATEDIDILVEESTVPRLRALTEKLGFRFDPQPLIFQNGGVRIYRLLKTEGDDFVVLDVLITTPLTQPAWNDQRVVETSFGPVRVVSPAGLILLKSLRRSSQDQIDIRQMKELADET
jgi:hypothetical protein